MPLSREENSSRNQPSGDPRSALATGLGAETSAAFTPGPYEVWSSLYEGFSASVVVNAEPLKTLAEVRSYRDALLFGAAPDMWEAARVARAAIVRAVSEQPLHGDLIRALNDAISAIDAALAKAGA